jgi:hypothetical protein
MEALTRPLRDIQRMLGRLHDLQVLLDCVREVEASGEVDAERTSLDAFAQMLEVECRRLHAEYVVRREDVVGVCGCARRELARQIAVGRPPAARAMPARCRPRAAVLAAAVSDLSAGAFARPPVKSGLFVDLSTAIPR